jgi:hypothetical protein
VNAQGRVSGWVGSYWFEAIPRERMVVFSRCIHGVLLLYLLRFDGWVVDHAVVPQEYFQPLALTRLLHLPPPTTVTMTVLRVGLGACCIGALAVTWLKPRRGLLPAARVLNALVFLGALVWLLWAFSYAKVDHDRLTALVALAVVVVVPGVGRGDDQLVGWGLRTIQVVFILAYPLSAISKFRKSGFLWANNATFARAIVRRGTPIGKWLLNHGLLLRVGQWAFISFEVLAVFALLREPRTQRLILAGVVGLHLFTYATIAIHFLPHTICILAFAPLEKLLDRGNRTALGTPSSEYSSAATTT